MHFNFSGREYRPPKVLVAGLISKQVKAILCARARAREHKGSLQPTMFQVSLTTLAYIV